MAFTKDYSKDTEGGGKTVRKGEIKYPTKCIQSQGV